MSDSTDIPRPQLTQYDLLQMKKEEQRRKKRARMAMLRLRLKELPPAEQEPFKARARDARARYKARHERHLHHSCAACDAIRRAQTASS